MGSTGALLRQGLLLLTLLALTALATFRVGEGVNPRYEVSATAAVLAGTGSYSGQEVYGSISHTNRVLAIALNATTTRDRVARQGLDPDYEAIAQERRSFLEIRVHSRSADVGLRTVGAVLDIGSQELQERQAEADTPVDARYALGVLQPPTVSDNAPWRARNMLLVALLGTVISLMLTQAARPALAKPRQASGRHRPGSTVPSTSG